jgi:hypothetical protein
MGERGYLCVRGNDLVQIAKCDSSAASVEREK